MSGVTSELDRVALAVGLPAQGATVVEVIERIAGLLADNRHWREKANGTDAELVRCRKRLADLTQQVGQLKADRWTQHRLASPPYYRNEGEQNAFSMVLHLLETGEVPS